MKNIFRIFVLFVIVFLGVVAYFHWDYLKVGRILPPRILIENCEDIKTEIEKYDWDVEMATAIMKAESKCDTEAKGDTDLIFEENGREYGYSVGVFQIRILPGREGCDTFDIGQNVKCAYDLYKASGDRFIDWSMYTNETYKDYMWHTPW